MYERFFTFVILDHVIFFHRKEQELNESNGNNENLLAQIESLKKKIRELEVRGQY